MDLFEQGDFLLHSGARSTWRVNAEVLSDGSWATLAAVAAGRLPAFGVVTGVPRGGLVFARELARYKGESHRVLVCDDVLTAGTSIAEARRKQGKWAEDALGVVAFARGHPEPWVYPVWVEGWLYLEMRGRVEAAEAERDALRARVAELEAQVAGLRRETEEES